MAEERSALSRLALEAHGMRLDTVPALVVRQAALSILDTVGCIIAGSQTAEAPMIAACDADGARSAGIAVPGTSWSSDLFGAIRICGYLGDALELNDLTGGHAGIGNVTAALALAQERGLGGAAMLEAVIRGIEVTTRVYDAVYPHLKRYTEVGMVPVGFPSAIGSACVAARALDLDQAQTLQAMAIAGGLAGWCPAEVIFGDGGTVKPLLFGAQPAEAGVKGALYARAGMTGPTHLLDSKLGYFATVSTGGALAPQRSGWALASPRRKLHACCGYIHSAADALAKLRARLGRLPSGATIEVRVPAYVADVVDKSQPPTSPNDARFHLQYCLALIADGHDAILPAHSIEWAHYLGSAAIVDAMARMTVVPDSALNHYHQCRVRVHGGDGGEEAVNAPRGSPQEPLSDNEVIAKFMMLAAPVIGQAAAAQFVRGMDNLENVEDVRPLLALLRP